jgi:hypothetical protein
MSVWVHEARDTNRDETIVPYWSLSAQTKFLLYTGVSQTVVRQPLFRGTLG